MSTKSELEAKFIEFQARLGADPNFWSLSIVKQAEELKVSRPTLSQWRSKLDWGAINKSRMSLSQERIAETLDALRKRVLQGSEKAVEISLAYYQNWSLKNVIEVSGGLKMTDESGASTEALLVAGLCSLPLGGLTAALERVFQSMPQEDRQAVLSRLCALEAVVIPFDMERAGRMGLPVEVQAQLTRAERGSGDIYYEEAEKARVAPEWGDLPRAVPQ